MDKYEQISVIGEGSYGVVLKCRHRETNQLVAVKKFLETDEDETIRKITLREIGILRRLKHENLVTLIEVLRHKKRFYLVFEYLEWTVLDELDRMPSGLGHEKCKERIFQVLRAISYCHINHVIHRDVKPENVLVSAKGVVKLCDFGFARRVNMSNESCTEYVATRWYRAPELLLGERNYGTGVDIWAIGCLFAEIMTGDPIFPGESDIDQIYLIVKLLGKPCLRRRLAKSTHFKDLAETPADNSANLDKMLSSWPPLAIEFFKNCLKMNPQERPTANELLNHVYFTEDKFSETFLKSLRDKIEMESKNVLLEKYKPDILVDLDKTDDTRCLDMLPDNVGDSCIVSKNTKRKFNNPNLFEDTVGFTKSEQHFNTSKRNEEYCGTHSSKNPINYSSEQSTEEMFSSTSEKYDVKSDGNTITFLNTSLNSSLDNSCEEYKNVPDVSNENGNQINQLRCKVPLKINGYMNCYQEVDESSLVSEKYGYCTNEITNIHDGSLNTESFAPAEIDQVCRYKKGKRKRNTLDISLPLTVIDKM